MIVSDQLIKVTLAAIVGAIGFLLVLVRNWFVRYRRSHPRAQSGFDIVTWAVLIIAALLLVAVFVFEYLRG
jgi:threonine/homoserine/homoserine lactone efflux protein